MDVNGVYTPNYNWKSPSCMTTISSNQTDSAPCEARGSVSLAAKASRPPFRPTPWVGSLAPPPATPIQKRDVLRKPASHQTNQE